MQENEQLMNYLRIATSLNEILDSGSSWYSTDRSQEMKEFVVHPLSLKQILFNCSLESVDQLIGILKKEEVSFHISPRVFVVKDEDSGTSVKVTLDSLVIDDELENSVPIIHKPVSTTIRNLFKLTLSAEIQGQINSSTSPMKIEEAVFQIKNSLSIADDLMPVELMGAVEGKFPDKPSRILNSLRIDLNGNAYNIYLLMKETNDGFIGFSAAVPGFTMESDKFSLEKLIGALEERISAASEEPFYPSFELSRLLKSLIFQLEFKKHRELKGPLLSEHNLSLLLDNGIVTESEDEIILSSDMTVDILKRKKSELDVLVRKEVDNWLETEVQL